LASYTLVLISGAATAWLRGSLQLGEALVVTSIAASLLLLYEFLRAPSMIRMVSMPIDDLRAEAAHYLKLRNGESQYTSRFPWVRGVLFHGCCGTMVGLAVYRVWFK
jgi:hypothetical protein